MPVYDDDQFTLAPTTGVRPAPPAPPLVPPQVTEDDVLWDNLSAMDRISTAFTRGRATVERGILGTQARIAGGLSAEQRAQLNNINDQINALGGNGPGFLGWVGDAAESAGSMVESIITPAKQVGEKFTAPDPNLSAIQQATQAIDAIGEAVVLPYAYWHTTYMTEGGNTYLDLLKDGVDPSAANMAAIGVGAINASLEMIGLGGATKPLATATKSLLKKATATAVKDPRVMRWVTRAALAWGKAVGSEVGTEVMQEVTSIAGEELAKRESGLEGKSFDDMVAQVTDVAIKTFKGMTLLALPGAATEFAATAKETAQAENQKKAAQELRKLIEEAPDKAVASEQAKAVFDRQGVTQVWIDAQAVVDAAGESDDPGAYYAALGVGDQIQEAALLGGDVKITGSKFIDLLQSDAFAALSDHIRYERDGKTIQETRDAESLSQEIDALGEDITDAEKIAEGEAPTEAKTPAQLDEELFGLQAFFKNAKDAGMTDKEYEKYLAQHAAAHEARIKKQEIIKLREQLRNNTDEMKARRAELEEVAREAVDNQPVYAALNGIGRERLNREALIKIVGEQNVKNLPRVNGRQIFETDGTIDPEEYAEAYGFEGADIMVFTMLDSPSKKDAIASMTDQMFNEKYLGLTEKQLKLAQDIEALHTDESAAILATELNKLREAIGQKALKPRILKLAARERLLDYKLKEINPKKFTAAEKKAAAEARKLLRKGDRQGAAKAKFRELLNHHFAIESYKIIEKTKNQYRYFQKFRKEPKRGAALPIDFFMAIRTMLGEMEFKKPSLTDFVHELFQTEGVMLEIPYQMKVDNGKRYYLDTTLRDWRTLYETVKATEHQGLELNRFMRAEERKTRDEVIAETTAAVRQNLRQGEPDAYTKWQRFKAQGKAIASLRFNIGTLVGKADGFEANGPVYRAIKRPYDLAMSKGYLPGQIGYVARHAKEAKRIKALMSIYTKKEQLDMEKLITIAGVNHQMSHERIIMVLLNNGNMGNRQAMIASGWTEKEIDLVIAEASEKDVKYAQGVWDYLDEFFPEVAGATKRRRNLIPEKVEARPVETKFGTLKGGYFPITFRNRGATILSNAQTSDIEKIQEFMRFGGYVSSMTRHGHTIEREGTQGRELSLNLFDLQRHVQHVVYDLEVGDATIDIFKILNHRDFKQAYLDKGNEHLWDQMELWFADIVMGEMHIGEGVESVFRWLRTGLVISRIGFNTATALMQPLGMLQSAALVGKRNMLVGLMTLLTHPLAGRAIREESQMMQQRVAGYNQDINDARNQLNTSLLRRLTPGESAEKLAGWPFWMLIKMQSFVDQATWLAAKRQGMLMFGDNDKAVEHADRMVIRTQGTGIFGERSPFERGTIHKRVKQTELVRVLVPLMNYYITKMNVAHERIRRTEMNPLSVMNTAVDLTLMFAVEAWLGSLLSGDTPGDDDGDWMGWAAWRAFKSTVAGLPVVNWFPQAVEGYAGGGTLPSLAQDVARLAVQARQGEVDPAAVRSAMRVGGEVLRIPGTAQMVRIGDGIVRAADGDDLNAMAILLGSRWEKQ